MTASFPLDNGVFLKRINIPMCVVAAGLECFRCPMPFTARLSVSSVLFGFVLTWLLVEIGAGGHVSGLNFTCHCSHARDPECFGGFIGYGSSLKISSPLLDGLLGSRFDRGAGCTTPGAGEG